MSQKALQSSLKKQKQLFNLLPPLGQPL